MATDKSNRGFYLVVDEIKNEFNLENNRICLSGFSQGCMMSLNVGLTSKKEFSCIVGFLLLY